MSRFLIPPWLHHPATYYLLHPLQSPDHHTDEEAPLTHVGTAASSPALKPAAATAGKTGALSGSVGQKCWETDICLAAVSSYGAMKGHHWLPLDQDTP